MEINISVENEIFEVCPNPIIVLDRKGCIIKANPASRPLLQFWQTEVGASLGVSGEDILHSKKARDNQEIEVATDLFFYSVRIVKNHDHTVLFATDITVSFLTNKKLNEADERYRLLAHHVTDIILRISADGTILYVSQACKSLLEYEPETLLGKSLFDLVHPEDAAETKSTFQLSSEQPFTTSYRIKNSHGVFIWMESVLKKVSIHEGKYEEILCVSRDISQRMDMEKDLREREQLYKSVVNNIREGLVICDLGGEINFVNSAMEQISEMNKETILGKNIISLIPPEQHGMITEKLMQRREGKSESYEFPVTLQSGAKRWLGIKSTPYRDAKGEVIGSMATIKDITEKKNQEEIIAKLSMVASKTDNGVIITDAKGNIEWINESFTKISGYSIEDVINKNPGDMLLGPESDPNTIQDIKNKVKEGKSVDTLILNYTKQKEPYWVQLEITPVRNEQGVITSYFSIQRDTTEKIQTLELLKESEQRYKNLLSASFEGIAIHNKGIILDCNSRFASMLGYSYSEILNTSIYDYIPRQYNNQEFIVKENIDEAREYIAIPKNKVTLPVEIVSKKHTYKNLTVKVTIIKDLSDRIKTLEKLKESELRYRDLVETSSNFIYTANHNGDFVYVNAIGLEKMGFSIEEFKKMNFTDVIPVAWKERVASFYKNQFLNKVKESYFEFPTLTKEGQEIWIGQNVQMLEDRGRITGFRAYARDITDRKKAEDALIRAKQKAEDSMLAKERFISIMSHEIRTPMNAVVGITNLLVQQSHTEEQKEYLHALKTSSDNLLKILNNVLDLSKLESGKVSFEKINFDLREILSEIQETFKFKAAEKNIEITNIVPPSVPETLSGDPLRLHQILLNLVSNAVKFTSEGKVVIEVNLMNKTDDEGLHFLFSVSDTGIGIPDNKLMEIFESFNQGNADTSRKFGGTGLGLTITKRLIELQGGTIQVESKPDFGSKFTFDLVFYPGSKHIQKTKVHSNYNIEGAKLLLVEDNEMNQLVVQRFLEKEHVEVTIAENGKKATEILESKKFDLVLMDLQMPVMDGYEATKYIRRMQNENANIPIIALTASASSDIEIKIRRYGMSDFITKPFEPANLYATIARHLHKEASKLPIQKTMTGKDKKKPRNSIRKIINLNYLKDASNGNTGFIKNMIEIFLKQTPNYFDELEKAYENQDWETLKKTIHKMKPTIPMMGIQMQKEVAEIEDSAKNMQHLDKVPELLLKLKNACNAAYVELKEELDNME